MKTLSVALLALAVATPTAIAQTAVTPANPSGAPGVATTTTAGTFYNRVGGEIRASKTIGTKVTNDANENIGDVNELILNKDGRVIAVVVGVGGFLGMGEHNVALDFKSTMIQVDGSNTVVKVNATKDQLKAAPQWKWDGSTTGNSTTK